MEVVKSVKSHGYRSQLRWAPRIFLPTLLPLCIAHLMKRSEKGGALVTPPCQVTGTSVPPREGRRNFREPVNAKFSELTFHALR
jgi:hypothetical protein